jgi:hypothetical protein
VRGANYMLANLHFGVKVHLTEYQSNCWLNSYYDFCTNLCGTGPSATSACGLELLVCGLDTHTHTHTTSAPISAVLSLLAILVQKYKF